MVIFLGLIHVVTASLKFPTCSRDAPVELSDFQHTAYSHMDALLRGSSDNRSCGPFFNDFRYKDFDQFLDHERHIRQKAVKGAMLHAWHNYEDVAFGFDAIKPVSGRGDNNWGGLGMTLVDALDTLLVMKMDDEYRRALAWVQDHLHFDKNLNVNTFETTIRLLGGLLSAFSLSNDTVLLDKAEDLGKRLTLAFSKRPGGLPYSDVNLGTGATKDGSGISALAEVYTPLEWHALANLRDCSFATGVNRAYQLLSNANDVRRNGIITNSVQSSGRGQSGSKSSFGARGDSFYEYELKMYLWSNGKDTANREAYDAFLKEFPRFVKKVGDKMLGVVELTGRSATPKMDHLACFLPGSFALDHMYGNASFTGYQEWSHGMTHLCYHMYNRTASFLAPEITILDDTELVDDTGSMHYILRPETMESLFLMSVAAYHDNVANDHEEPQPAALHIGKEKLRQLEYENWGWNIFMAFQRKTRTRFGYASVENVQRERVQLRDDTPSFFFAETLKYSYMLFEPKCDAKALLDKFILTTEAHFIPRSDDRCTETRKFLRGSGYRD